MKEYKIARERLIKNTPDKLIADGRAVFGTFDEPIKGINMTEVRKQCKLLPDFCNAMRLTEWEAFELDFNEATILMAVYKNLHLNGMGILIYYDKQENKIYSYKHLGVYKEAKVASNLYNSRSSINAHGFTLSINNDCENKTARAKAIIRNKKNGDFMMDCVAREISQASIVSIPLGPNKPLYSQKSFFKAEGTIRFKNKIYNLNNARAIIDDHKGFYPYKSHYDWLTTMSLIKLDGKKRYFGFNLTKNQSMDEEKYNENCIWLDNEYYYLPPVEFKKSKNKWLISDEYGYVNLEFKILNQYNMKIHLGIIDINYKLPFGYLNGYLKANDGRKIEISNLIGVAEDKSTRL